MAKATGGIADEDDGDGINPALARNFRALIGERSVAQLRDEMAREGISIGAGAIQAAKKGSTGLRLETLEKFATFFGRKVTDLLSDPEGATAWPFPDLRADFFAGLTEGQRYEVQGIVRRTIMDYRDGSSGGGSTDHEQLEPALRRAR